MSHENNETVKQQNIIKTQDDHLPVFFETVDNKKERFKLSESSTASWATAESELDVKILRTRIEPWLTALFQSEHFSLLVGSGLTHAVHSLVKEQENEEEKQNSATSMKAEQAIWPDEFNQKIIDKANSSAKKAGRKKGNFEDQLRVANELLRCLDILGQEDQTGVLKVKITHALNEFAVSILRDETSIATADEEKREQAFNTLITFLMSFASRTGTRDRLNIFTTNYDRLIEAGAELAGLHLLDRFLGNLMPIFRSSRLDLDMHYNPPGIRGEPRYLEGVARFTKLHGSLDWVQVGDDIRRIGLPFGAEAVKPYLQAPGLNGASSHELMIYPNSAKDRETADYPYVDLFRDFAAAICRPNSTLVTYGYSFGDEHINRVIRDMLTIPSTHLVIISRDDPLGRIMQTYHELGRPSQISLMIGPELSDLQRLTEHFLPKAAIDKTTFRMTELLKRRFGGDQTMQAQGSTASATANEKDTAL